MPRIGLNKNIVALLAAALLAASPALALPPEGKGKPGKGGSPNEAREVTEAGISISLASAGITFAEARSLAVEGGHTGFAELPPGIRKNLGRGKPLPPGIAKKMAPGPMLAKLPARPGYEWRICGADLVLVATATAIIADVLTGVFK